jgi:hypothetical protein
MDGNIWFWLGMLAILIYFLVGYTVIKSSQDQNESQGFVWNLKTIGYIIAWGPLLIISYVVLQFNKDKLNLYSKSKNPEDRDEDDDSSYH